MFTARKTSQLTNVRFTLDTCVSIRKCAVTYEKWMTSAIELALPIKCV